MCIVITAWSKARYIKPRILLAFTQAGLGVRIFRARIAKHSTTSIAEPLCYGGSHLRIINLEHEHAMSSERRALSTSLTMVRPFAQRIVALALHTAADTSGLMPP